MILLCEHPTTGCNFDARSTCGWRLTAQGHPRLLSMRTTSGYAVRVRTFQLSIQPRLLRATFGNGFPFLMAANTIPAAKPRIKANGDLFQQQHADEAIAPLGDFGGSSCRPNCLQESVPDSIARGTGPAIMKQIANHGARGDIKGILRSLRSVNTLPEMKEVALLIAINIQCHVCESDERCQCIKYQLEH